MAEKLKEKKEKKEETTEDRAARKIQKQWRSFVDKKIYFYFRDLIISRRQSDPHHLLKLVNSKEAELIDRASGLFLMFRLGGSVFPPVIYYKIFTNRPISDINAFAPRNYAAMSKGQPSAALTVTATAATAQPSSQLSQMKKLIEAKNQGNAEQWYERSENNEWRVVGDAFLPTIGKPRLLTLMTKPFHHSSLVRKVDVLKKRKRKKLAWLKKIYSRQDDAAEPSEAVEKLLSLNEADDVLFEQNWEEEVDDLLEWSNELDFEQYHNQWLETARTGTVE